MAESPVQRVEWYDQRRYTRASSTVKAVRLWVAGSYARGAEVCGDLDLILEATIRGGHPPSAAIKNALLGRVQDTSLYIGTPQKNSSNIAFPEARLVWSRESSDWRANIAAIETNAGAARFARPTDRLPLRPEQLSAGIGDLEELIRLEQDGVLAWEFVYAADIPLSSGALRNARLQRAGFGAKTREALEVAISLLGSTSPKRGWRRLAAGEVSGGLTDRTAVWFDGTLVAAGVPPVPRHWLDTPYCDRLAIAPHRSRRGPNGVWIIRRGPNHPLEHALAAVRAFYVTLNGHPVFFERSDAGLRGRVMGIDLFLEEADAVEELEELIEMVGDDDQVSVSSASGTELLALIAGCDVVEVDRTAIAQSPFGERVLQLDGEDVPDRIGGKALLSALHDGERG